MLCDCHIHTYSGLDKVETLAQGLDQSGVDKIVLFSYHPDSFELYAPDKPADRLGMVLSWAKACPEKIIPYHWIDPMDGGVFEEIDRAVEMGIHGFKIICNRFFPRDDRPMRVCAHIAKTGRPIIFHSGILYAGLDASQYNRPIHFEKLFDIPNLKFMMGHVSWPWQDECLAVYGKWRYNKENKRTSAQLYLNTAPGTPAMYREEVLTKVFRIGFGAEDHVVFASSTSSRYEAEHVSELASRDCAILDKLGIDAKTREKYFGENFLKFVELGTN